MFFIAVSTITYLLAIVNTLLFERPFQKLSDAFILKRVRKSINIGGAMGKGECHV